MNIFALDSCPQKAAKAHCDRHVTKMPLETAQLLCNAFWAIGKEAPYKKTHSKHPCSIFVSESCLNFEWTLQLGFSLCDEYTARYGKSHASLQVLQWCNNYAHELHFEKFEMTDFAIAISDDCECRKIKDFNSLSSIDKYKAYYQLDKKHLHQWKMNKPDWIK